MTCLFENLGVALRFSFRLQERRIGDLQQPADERSAPGVCPQLVPGMHKAILGKIISLYRVRRQLSQEISDLGLVAANQFPERRGIVRGDRPRDEEVILGVKDVRGLVN